MGVDYSFLHKTLKDPTRREILRHLSNGPLTYMELMNLSRVTNTGRFNYHLKALGDLIEKMEDGRYRLTERGQLAIQLLEKFPEKPIETVQATAEVTMQKGKTRPQVNIPKKPTIAVILVVLIGISGFVAISTVQTANETLPIAWQQYLPGVSGNSVIQTSDGGYLALGQNASLQDNSFINYTSLVVKTDSLGNPVWTKNYSIEGAETRLTFVVQVSDGYVLAGSRAVKTIFPVANLTEFGIATQQFCLLKIDSQGNIQWANTYVQANQTLDNLPLNVQSYSLGAFIQTSDGGFALIGSYTFTAPSNQYLWLVKTDAKGNLQWNKTFSTGSYASAIFQTSDQGYVIVGTQTSQGPSPSMYEIIKADLNGSVQWYKTYGGTGDSYSAKSTSGLTTADGGYIIAGSASSQGGAPTGWIIKTNAEGTLLSEGITVWNKTYAYDYLPSTILSITSANDGGFMFVGTATKETNYGEFDANSRTYTWIAQIDNSGNLLGQVAIDMGNHFTNPASIIQAKDGGHVFVGVWTQSTQPSLDQRFWIVKIANPNFVSSLIWLSLKLAIILAVVIIETVIVVITWKRTRRNSVY